MDNKYKHLDDQNLENAPEGWVPSIPLPFYGGRLLRRTYECNACHRRYRTEAEYKMHYRTSQLSEMNEAMGAQRAMAVGKGTFWRRIAYVYRYGTPAEITNLEHMFDGAGWPENVSIEKLGQLNDTLLGLWGPVRERQTGTNPVEDTADVEDQTPDEAKSDFADPYTVVNSKGVTYYLNMKYVTLRAGKKVPIWFFSKDFRPQTGQRKLPEGYTVHENERNGYMTVRKPKGMEPKGPEGSEDQ